MLEWIKIRDDVTCEVYHRLWDHNISKYVIQINKVNKLYKVQILDHVPWRAARLNAAKEFSQRFYEQTCTNI